MSGEIIIVTEGRSNSAIGDTIRSLPIGQILGGAVKIAEFWLSAKQIESQTQIQQSNIWSQTMQYLSNQNQQNIETIEAGKCYRQILKPLARAHAKSIVDKTAGTETKSLWEKIVTILGFVENSPRR